jgi:hypothetical protein
VGFGVELNIAIPLAPAEEDTGDILGPVRGTPHT